MPISNPKEEIDARVLRLIGLEDVFDLDYETYLTLLKEAMVKSRMTKKTIPTEEVMLLTEEYKRVKSKKDSGRFEVKKKKITSKSFAVGGVKGQISGAATKALPGTAIGSSPLSRSLQDSISTITSAVVSIAETLRQQKKISDDASAYDKRKAEQEKRGLAESKLEKRFEGLKKAAEKIIAPVKSILDKIFEFITTVLLGRIVYKLIEWFGDPKNADKVKAITRFLGDHWPKLLALYLTFGTSFGRFALGLTRAVARGAVKLLAKIALLAAAKKMRGARGVAKFLGGGKGKLLANVVGTGVALGGAYAVTQGFKGIGGEQKSQGFSGGGYVRPKFPTFAGGGFNFKGMMGGASMGAMFGPLGMLLGGMFGSGKSQQMMSGFVSGEKGVDKVPAMLSDGEFVMSTGAVQKYGVDTLEAMNAAGGGTNKPKIMSGTTYAQGGGLIGADKTSDPSYRKNEQKLKEQKKEEVSSLNYPKMSDQTLGDRIKRIEQQMQVQRALASGKGINIKGASFGTDVGTGYGAKYMGRDAIKVKLPPGGSFESEITLAGKRYFAMKKGDEVIYTSQDPRDRNGGGFLQPGGLFGGPRMSSRMDYAQSKGKYYSSSDRKTYGSYNDAMAAKQSRMTSLASQQRLNRLSSQGAGQKTGRGIRYTTEAVASERERINRGGIMGQLGRSFTRMFSDPNSKLGKERLAKLNAADKASTARVKQAGAVSIGRYYSSSDGKYYKDYNAAIKARRMRLAAQQKKPAAIKPPVKPKPKYTPAGGGMNGGRSSAGPISQVTTPRFSASTKGSKTKADLIGVHR